MPLSEAGKTKGAPRSSRPEGGLYPFPNLVGLPYKAAPSVRGCRRGCGDTGHSPHAPGGVFCIPQAPTASGISSYAYVRVKMMARRRRPGSAPRSVRSFFLHAEALLRHVPPNLQFGAAITGLRRFGANLSFPHYTPQAQLLSSVMRGSTCASETALS